MNQTGKKMAKDVILVVDDQPNNLKVIASVLGSDYSVSIANSGPNALKILENYTPDLILLDIMMPDMDGFEVCRKIMENERIMHIPIIFLSAKADVEDVIRGFSCGAVDYITKPFNATEVEARVRNHLNLKHALNDLKIANQNLHELNATKDKLFSIIAHDLKSPFNGILGLSEILLDQVRLKNYDGVDEYAEMIYQSSQRAFDLLLNLLEWSRSQTGRIEYAPEIFELNGFIETITPLFDDVAAHKSIIIKRNLTQNILAYADKKMISVVLRNLISNAIKFTRQEGEIIIDTRKEQNEITVTVSDNGVGISKHRIEWLFHIDQSDSTHGTAGEQGTGLGLILCKEFVEKHGGRIWAESEEGRGSAFSFALPLELQTCY
jgi:two-component system, sensor histidine kinase and response regulator